MPNSQPAMPNRSILMVAGERSGDVYGAALARALGERLPGIRVFGCGGDAMREAGVETTVDAHSIALAGIVEIVSGLPSVYRAFHALLDEVRKRQPALAVLIDFPDFNLRLAKKLKAHGIPVVYFVSPQVWAWRKGRVNQIKATVTKMLCIFDFEEKMYREAGVPVEYVGHPLVDLARAQMTRGDFCSKFGIDPAITIVALLPGSREREVQLNLPPLLEAAAQLAARRKVQFILPVAGTLRMEWMENLLRQRGPGAAQVRLIAGLTHDVLEHSDVAVVASGTATVEAALHVRPMVVVYRVSALTWTVGKLLVSIPHYSMVNLLAGKALVKELMQSNFTGQNVAAEVECLLDNPQARNTMADGLRAIRARLGSGGAMGRAADAISHVYNNLGATIGVH
jgi:lipid-A-disaccharide synthase